MKGELKIREAVESDSAEIVQVLKASLGEEELSLSEKVWNYKHKENPFGESLVLVAEEGGFIIGVRAFMKWKWNRRETEYYSYRAVDTATHPEHQGKGIFKKLTLEAIRISIEKKANFVFNTPNEKSRPGYLKMGWGKVGKLNVAVKPVLKFWNFKRRIPNYRVVYEVTPERVEQLCKKWNSNLKKSSFLYTPKSLQYLRWRYENNALIEYEVYASSGFYLACYVKRRKHLNELRIAECILENKKNSKIAVKKITELASRFGVQVISCSENSLHLPFPFLKGPMGPILTVRELNLNSEETNQLFHVGEWGYSLGDLELF